MDMLTVPIFHCKAKPFTMDPGFGLDHNATILRYLYPLYFLVSKNAKKFALPPTPNLKLALPQTRNPSTSQWNISCVGSQMQISPIGHVHFIFCVDFICVG